VKNQLKPSNRYDPSRPSKTDLNIKSPTNLLQPSKFESAHPNEAPIDLSSYISPCPSSQALRSDCARQILRSLEKTGFCMIHGTGISPALCSSALDETSHFFRASEKVRKSARSNDRARRGYVPANEENFGSLLSEGRQPNDLVWKFRVGPEAPCKAGGDAGSPLLRPNSWPSADAWGKDQACSFRQAIGAYFVAMETVAGAVVNAITDAVIDLHPDLDRPLSTLRGASGSSILTCLGYKHGARHNRARPLVAPHTDVGVITLLHFDGDGGSCAVLQRAHGGTWVNVSLPKDLTADPVFVVNAADIFSDLTGGIVRSTLHRVMPVRPPAVKKGKERYCLAFFVGLNPDAELELPATGEKLTYEMWRRGRIKRAQDTLKSKN